MAKMIRAVIFDCFGVLFPNACNLFVERHHELFKGQTALVDELNARIDLDEITSAEFFTALGQICGMPADEIRAEFERDLLLNQSLADFIKSLKLLYKIGLLSNAGSEEIMVVDKAGIGDLFDARAVSAEVGSVKPQPEIFKICAERLGVATSECVFIDDSKPNLPPAEALGMKTILYTNLENLKQKFEEQLRLSNLTH
jgi:epoxide hydrolase-like predicted phosphatase